MATQNMVCKKLGLHYHKLNMFSTLMTVRTQNQGLQVDITFLLDLFTQIQMSVDEMLLKLCSVNEGQRTRREIASMCRFGQSRMLSYRYLASDS